MKTMFLGTVLSTILLLAACKPSPAPDAVVPDAVVPELVPSRPAKIVLGEQELARVDGQGSVKLDALHGASFFLYFYGPWTDGGQRATEHVAALVTTGLKVLPVVVDRREMPSSRNFVEPGGLPAVFSDEALLEVAGPVRALPTTLLVGPDGALQKAWPGHVAWTNILAMLENGDEEAVVR